MSETSPEPELELLPVQMATLDDEKLAELLVDLGALGEGLTVKTKDKPGSYARPEPWSLSEAVAALKSGQVMAVQLRYVHQGKSWCDTLLATPEGTRLVRAQQPAVIPIGG